MLNIISKFNEIPEELRQKVSTPEVVKAISELEKECGFSLATIVMKVMVKDISLLDLSKFFVFEHKMQGRDAETLVDNLKEKVFRNVSNYLGFEPLTKEPVIKLDDKQEDGNLLEPINLNEKTEENVNNNLNLNTVASSSFFFSPEDEEEVMQLAQKVGTAKKPEKPKRTIDEKVDILLKRINVSFSSEEMYARLKSALKTYIKGVRNRVDTKQTLIKSVHSGGLSIDTEKADEILEIAELVMDDDLKEEKEKKEIKIKDSLDKMYEEELNNAVKFQKEHENVVEEKKKIDIPGLTEVGSRDVAYDFNALKEEEKKSKDNKNIDQVAKVELQKNKQQLGEKKAELKKVVSENEKVNIGNEKLQGKKSSKEVSGKENLKPNRQQIIEKPKKSMNVVGNDKLTTPVNMTPIRQSAPEVTGKKKMEDVKYVPKLMGPIEELKEMSVVNFERLSKNPKEAAEKIKEKLKFLEQENIGKKLEGIRAWRQSKINLLYIEIGLESVEKNMGIDDVIEVRQREGKDYLNKGEFNAIMQLNKDIRY